MNPPERSTRLLRLTVAVSLTLAGVSLAVMWLTTPDPPPGAAGPVLPRTLAPVGGAGAGQLLRTLGVGSLTWYVSILSAPGFVWLSRRMPLDHRRWPGRLLVWLVVIVVLVAVTSSLQYRLAFGTSSLGPPLSFFVRATLVTGALPFIAVAAAAQAIAASAKAREREVEAARVRGHLAEARLERLTAQLQPHFLFNTLQGISTLIHSDPLSADRMLTRLGDLLRQVLSRAEQREVTIAEETALLESYLEIQRVRFGERLDIEVVVDPTAAGALVPFFLLQPLVENALRHGVEKRSGSARVVVGATRRGERLVLSVADDGPGDAGGGEANGIGLANTRARLAELYPAGHDFYAGAPPEGGFRVEISIPWRDGTADR